MGFKPHEEEQIPWIDPSRTEGWLDRVRRPSRKAAVPSTPQVTKDEQQPPRSMEDLRRAHFDALLKQREAWLIRLSRSRGLEYRLRCLKEIAFLDEQIKKLENGVANSGDRGPSKKSARRPKRSDPVTLQR